MIINDFVIFAAVNYAYVGIVALFVILVIVFAILSAKNWHWSNVVFLSLTAIAAAFAANGMATVFDQRTKAMKDYAKQEAAFQRAEEALQQARSGAILAETYEPGTLRYVDEKLSQALLGRGRAWSGGTAVLTDQATLTYKYTFPAKAGDEEPSAIGLKDYRLFAFVEVQSGQKILSPENFVGVFRVLEETGTDLTIQLINYGAPKPDYFQGKTWTLFEKMPLDRRGIFRDAIIAEAEAYPDDPKYADYRTLAEMYNDDNKKLDISLLRKVLQERYLSPGKLGFNFTPQNPNAQADRRRYEYVLDRYSFDGQSLSEIEKWIETAPNRIADSFNPLPREIFVAYQFSKDTGESVNPPNPPIKVDETGKLENTGFFTENGGAIVPQLQQNGEAEFKEGDVVYVDSLTAAGYKRGEGSDVPAFASRPVDEVGRYYFRAVQNYPYEFSELRLEIEKVNADLAVVAESIATQQEINATVEKQRIERVNELSAVTADNESLAQDAKVIKDLLEEKQRQLAQAKSEIDRLEKTIEDTYRNLRKKMLEMSQRAFASN